MGLVKVTTLPPLTNQTAICFVKLVLKRSLQKVGINDLVKLKSTFPIGRGRHIEI